MSAPFRLFASSPVASGRLRGFTLVELSLVLVVTGSLLAMATRGLTLVDDGKATQLVLQVRQLESMARDFQRTRQRWPGDCNGDGLIDAPLSDVGAAGLLQNARASRSELFDYATPVPLPFAGGAVTGAVPTSPGMGCPLQAAEVLIQRGAVADFNLPFNDFKVQGLLGSGQPNRVAATHAGGDFLALVQVKLGAVSATDSKFNAIVVMNVPIGFAQKLAVSLNGADVESFQGRVRRLNAAGTGFDTRWMGTGETAETTVNVAYFFDQLPLLQLY